MHQVPLEVHLRLNRSCQRVHLHRYFRPRTNLLSAALADEIATAVGPVGHVLTGGRPAVRHVLPLSAAAAVCLSRFASNDQPLRMERLSQVAFFDPSLPARFIASASGAVNSSFSSASSVVVALVVEGSDRKQ